MAQSLLQVFGNSKIFRGALVREFMQSAHGSHAAASSVIVNKCRPSPVHPSLLSDSITPSILRTQYIVDPLKIKIIDLPFPVKNQISDVPRISNVKYEDKLPVEEIQDPVDLNNGEKKAARLIVIRRRKMKRHKLKKLRIRMKFEWAKRRQKREMKKEKLFQAELLAQVRQAESFNAELFAKEKTKLAKEKPFPRRWKGKRLPRFVIEELLERKKKRIEAMLASQMKRKSMSMNPADYPYTEH